MSDTTQAIRAFDAYVEATRSGRPVSKNGALGYNEAEFEAWQAATLAERERCAVLCESMTIRKRWARSGVNGLAEIEPCKIAARIREEKL